MFQRLKRVGAGIYPISDRKEEGKGNIKKISQFNYVKTL